MFVKLMTGPHVPHEEDAKVRFAARRIDLAALWGAAGSMGRDVGHIMGGWHPLTAPCPSPGLCGHWETVPVSAGLARAERPRGTRERPFGWGEPAWSCQQRWGWGTRCHCQQERARPLSPPSPISAFHTTKQHLPLCQPAPRFTATPRGNTTERQKPPGSFSADPGLLQKLSPAPGCRLSPRSCPFPQATALLRAFPTISRPLPQIKHWFLLTISHLLPQIKHWFFLKKSCSLPKLKRWPLLPGSAAPGQAGAAGAQDLTCGGAGARALPVPRFLLPLTALRGRELREQGSPGHLCHQLTLRLECPAGG